MKTVIVHNEVAEYDGPDVQDVLVQAATVESALVNLGHKVDRLACNKDLDHITRELKGKDPDLVVNLVEELGGHGSLIHIFPYLLDALNIPYTGNSAHAILNTSNKTMAKEIMARSGLPTPDWIGPWPMDTGRKPVEKPGKRRWIIKSLWEHASLGLDSSSLLEADNKTVMLEMSRRAPHLGNACFAEEYIDGREFNLALLQDQNEVLVLDPAEIIFTDFKEQPHIVDYQAKWQEDSFAFNNTPRTFDFAAEDQSLLTRIKELARRCWHVFSLSGYARVDFRVAPDGTPFILEINTNPCLSPDAGFAAAAEHSGLSMDMVIAKIIAGPRNLNQE